MKEQLNILEIPSNKSGEAKSIFEKKVRVEIEEEIYLKIIHAVKHLGKENLEVGGKLKIKFIDNTLKITDYNLLKQKVGATDFEIDEEAIGLWMLENMDKEDFKEWRGWWHSHHNMGLFWSGTDNEMFNKLLEGSEEYKDCIGLVFTTDGNFRARYDVKTPYGVCINDDIEVTILRKEDPEKEKKYEITKKEIETEIEEKVEKWKYVPKTYGQVSFERYGYGKVKGKNFEIWNYLEDEEHFMMMRRPKNIQELLELTEINKLRYQEWNLQQECYAWGIDFDKVNKEIEKRKKKNKNKMNGKCSWCREKDELFKVGDEQLCNECLSATGLNIT